MTVSVRDCSVHFLFLENFKTLLQLEFIPVKGWRNKENTETYDALVMSLFLDSWKDLNTVSDVYQLQLKVNIHKQKDILWQLLGTEINTWGLNKTYLPCRLHLATLKNQQDFTLRFTL